MDIQILVFCTVVLSLISFSKPENHLQTPDYTSTWQFINAHDGNMARIDFKHGLGQVPVLVVVQTKCPKGEDKDFVFHAIGIVPRDDDSPSTFGAITYIYDDETISISAMTLANNRNFDGLAIFTDNTAYWAGPSATRSEYGYVRALAWKSSSLPPPDFHISGKRISVGMSADSYIEYAHDFGSYPSMVVVRTKLLVENKNIQNYYSDAVGSGISTYKDLIYRSNGYVIYGYDDSRIRLWVDNSTNALLFNGIDIGTFDAQARMGELEILAWTNSSLNITQSYQLSLGAQEGDHFEDETPLENVDLENGTTIVNVMAKCNSGPNAGFLFPGSGAMASVSLSDVTCNDTESCRYGGLGYAYTDSYLRIWKPNTPDGSIIAIPSQFGSGINTQRTNNASAVVNIWVTQDNIISQPGYSPSVEGEPASFTGIIIITVIILLMICVIALAVAKYFVEKRKRRYKIEPCWLVTPKEMAMKYPKPNIDDFMAFNGSKT